MKKIKLEMEQKDLQLQSLTEKVANLLESNKLLTEKLRLKDEGRNENDSRIWNQVRLNEEAITVLKNDQQGNTEKYSQLNEAVESIDTAAGLSISFPCKLPPSI